MTPRAGDACRWDARPGTLRGSWVEMVVGSMLNVFILFYVTAVCGLPGGLAGLALGAGLVVDAVMDPADRVDVGWLAIAVRPPRAVHGRVAGAAPAGFQSHFALPSTLGTAALFVWLMFLSVTLRISLSIFTLPYQALGAEISDDYAERSSIAAWRWGIGIVGTVAVIFLGYGVFLAGPGGVSHRTGLPAADADPQRAASGRRAVRDPNRARDPDAPASRTGSSGFDPQPVAG